MVAWPAQKVGVIPCAGEEMVEGTLSLTAARLVLAELRPDLTVSMSLAAFVTGGQNEHAFAKVYPVVTIDGCAKRCAARALGASSAEPAAEVVVSQIARSLPGLVAASRRHLDSSGRELARRVADEVARLVDELHSRPTGAAALCVQSDGPRPAAGVSCPCQAEGPPVTTVLVSGQPVGIAGLRPIMEDLARMSLSDDDLAAELLRRIKVYNYVPPALEKAYAKVAWQEFLAYRAQEKL